MNEKPLKKRMIESIVDAKDLTLGENPFYWYSQLDFSKDTSNTEYKVLEDKVEADLKKIEEANHLIDCYYKLGVVELDKKHKINEDIIKLWKPIDGELCIFWDNNDDGTGLDYWVIGNFDTICEEKYFLDTNGNKWENVAPLEYVEILKNERKGRNQ